MNVTAFDVRRGELPLHPIEPNWITEGVPVARALTLTESPDGHLSTGLWECTAGKFKWIYGLDEIVHILEGEVVVRDLESGVVHTLGPGDGAFFPMGAVTHWHVPKYVKKLFVLRSPGGGLLARIHRRIARWRAP